MNILIFPQKRVISFEPILKTHRNRLRQMNCSKTKKESEGPLSLCISKTPGPLS